MSKDSAFTKDSEFREMTDRDLYYDLGYKIAGKEKSNVSSNTVILYLFSTSLALQLFSGINQIFTIVFILIYGIAHQYGQSFISTERKTILLILVLISTIIDHTQAGLIIYPGSFTSEYLTYGAWTLEILWILLFGVEFLSLYAPVQNPATEGRTVIPATEFTEENYNSLKERIQGSDYNITDFEEEVDTSLLQINFRNQIQYVIGLFLLIVLLDILIWEIISLISGGDNVDESYFVSGVSFVIYIFLIVFSGYFFRSEKSDQN